MNTKLTLTVDKSVIERAKIYSKRSGRSLSDLIEAYLDRLTSSSEEEVPVEFKDIYGMIELDDHIDDKTLIRKLANEKHA